MDGKVLLFIAIFCTVSCYGSDVKNKDISSLETSEDVREVLKPILAPIVDKDDPVENSFTPGRIISGLFSPLARFRDSVLNIPAVQRPLFRQANPATPTTEFVTDCSMYSGIQCSDCNTFVLCFRETEPRYTQLCPASTPFCTTSGCSETTDDQQCAKLPNIVCTAEGYFPDPRNCSLFYYCPTQAAPLANILTYECPPNYHFNSRTRNCQRKLLMLPHCKPFNCEGKGNQFIVYPQNHGYFAFCSVNAETNETRVNMFKCPDTDNQVYNLDTLGCEYKCRREGFFEDTLDCQSYYFCYRDSRFALKYLHETCPPSYRYRDGKCVKTAAPCVTGARR